jgi:predicted lipid-binding transport protein (Tim44 family)
MNQPIIQLLVLLAVAVFLILRLRNVLGTREGFEKKPVPLSERESMPRRDFEVIEGGPDKDITDHVEDGTTAAKALGAMKMTEPGFNVTEFIDGARGAYEWILMAFENGDLTEVRDFLSEEVFEAFDGVIQSRAAEGLTVEAEFVGVREIKLAGAEFDRDSHEGEITVRFVGELAFAVRNADGEVVEGNPGEIKRQRDVWTFARDFGSDDPNWRLVATGE